MAHVRPYAPLRVPLDKSIAKRTFWMSLCGGFVQHPRAPPEPRPPGATRGYQKATGRDQGATARPRKATRSHRKLPEPARNHQMPPEGHQNAFWWPPKLDYHARGIAKRQTPPGGTGGHQKPPEGRLKVTFNATGGSQRLPKAARSHSNSNIAREVSRKKK